MQRYSETELVAGLRGLDAIFHINNTMNDKTHEMIIFKINITFALNSADSCNDIIPKVPLAKNE